MDLLSHQLIDEWQGRAPCDRCIIERDKALDLLDEIRGQFPMAELRLRPRSRSPAGTTHIASRQREADLTSARLRTRAKQIPGLRMS